MSMSDGMIKLVCDFCEKSYGYILFKPLDETIDLKGAQAACEVCMKRIVDDEPLTPNNKPPKEN